MFKSAFIALFVTGTLVTSAPLIPTASPSKIPQLNTTGFIDPQITYSHDRHAMCISGVVEVAASTNANVHLNITSTLTNEEATQLILDLNTANSSGYLSTVVGPQTTQGGTWNISSRLCFPSNTTSPQAGTSQQVQLLSHGVAFDQAYWDFPNPESSSKSNESQTDESSGRYSYVDFAARQGRMTFTYDRLGIGQSSKPDPVQTVQGPLQIQLLHSLVGMLRTGRIGNIAFDSVIGVAHSYGSALTAAVAREYPTDFSAIVLTGFSSNTTGAAQFTSALNLLPAATVDTRFSSLLPGYLVPSTRAGVQYSFFAYPDFEPGVLSEAYRTIATTTVGEQATMALVGGVATNFTRPVYVLDGERDLFFCDGDCDVLDAQGRDIPAQTISKLFPAADAERSGSSVLLGSGHGVNLAANAEVASQQIQSWIARL